MLITPEYQALNAQMHKDRPDYGISAQYTNNLVYSLITSCRYESILDYGAGKRNLEYITMNRLLNDPAVDWKPSFRSYDPAIPEISNNPTPADLVVCADVLEHVERECLVHVLNSLVFCAAKALLITIHLGPAKKFLPDGRNAHLIQHRTQWWINQVNHLTNIVSLYHPDSSHVVMICKNGE